MIDTTQQCMNEGDDFDSKEAFAVMFDILGFKILRQAKGTVALSTYYDNIVFAALKHAKAKYMELTDNTVSFSAFSDTILIYSKNVSVPTFMVVLAASRELLQLGFCGGQAPFRGAIGYGDLSSRKGILIGSSIEDAYHWEQAQVWSGCMLTPDLCAFLEKNGHFEAFKTAMKFAINQRRSRGEPYVDEENFSQLLLRYPIPLQEKRHHEPVKYESTEGIAMDWTHKVAHGVAAKAFLPSESEHPTRIRENTIEFERWVRSQATTI